MHFKTRKSLATSFSFNKIRKRLIEDLYFVCKYFICFSLSLEEYFSLVVRLATKFKRNFFPHTGEGRIPNILGISFCFNNAVFYKSWLSHNVLAVFLQYVWLFLLYLLIPWKEKLYSSQPKTSCWSGCQQNCGVRKNKKQTNKHTNKNRQRKPQHKQKPSCKLEMVEPVGSLLTFLLPCSLGCLSPSSWSVSFVLEEPLYQQYLQKFSF